MAAKKKTTKKKAAKKKAASKPRDYYTQQEASKLFGVSVDMFRRYCAEHEVEGKKVGREVRYSVDQLLILKGRVEHKKGVKVGESNRPADLGEILEQKEEAELDWTRERAEGQRLKNAAMRRELAPVRMVTWAISQAGGQIAAALGTLKGKVKRAQPELGNEALHEIEQVVVECQNAAADIKLDWDEFDESDLADPRVH